MIVTSVNGNKTGRRVLEKILLLYCEIYRFIEIHDREGLNRPNYRCEKYSSRDVTAMEVGLEIRMAIAEILDITDEISQEVKNECFEIINPSYIAREAVMNSAFTSHQGEDCMSKMEAYGFVQRKGSQYIWISTKALYGYFVFTSSLYFGLRNKSQRIPWRHYKNIFQNHEELEITARQSINDWHNEGLSKPAGYEKINQLFPD